MEDKNATYKNNKLIITIIKQKQCGPNRSWEGVPSFVCETTTLQKWRPRTLQNDQLPGGCDWLVSVLWFDEVLALLEGVEAATVAEEELTPLEVLIELCWMASFWGLPGMDISSQLSSLSETVLGKMGKLIRSL